MEQQSSILLVDDDSDDQEIFEIALEDTGLPVQFQTADNGVEAVKLISSPSFQGVDFIFIDLNMPFMSGKECLKAIKEHEHLKQACFNYIHHFFLR